MSQKKFVVALKEAHWTLFSASVGAVWKGLNSIYDRDGRWVGSFAPSPCGRAVQVWDAPEWVAEKCREAFGESIRVQEC